MLKNFSAQEQKLEKSESRAGKGRGKRKGKKKG